jgi:hypothetical protein
MNDKVQNVIKRWNEIEPLLKKDEVIDEEIYSKLLWFDYAMSELYNELLNNKERLLMRVNERLKLEFYNSSDGVSGENWLIAMMGYDDLVGKEVAITTDNVRGSEAMGSVIDYAVLFKEAPRLYNLLWKILNEYSEDKINRDTMIKVRDKLLEMDGEIEQIESGN